MSWVYVYMGRDTRDGSVLIKGISCTNMYPNIHVIMLNDRIHVTQSGATTGKIEITKRYVVSD